MSACFYIVRHVPFLLLLLLLQEELAVGVLRPDEDDQPQCHGLYFDIARMESLDSNNNNDGIGSEQQLDLDNWYPVSNAMSIELPRSSSRQEEEDLNNCQTMRLRVEEKIQGVPIYGSNMVMTLEYCPSLGEPLLTSETATTFRRDYSLQEQLTSWNHDNVQIIEQSGKRFPGVHVIQGYIPTHTAEQATQAIVQHYGVLPEAVDVGPMELIIFPTTTYDYLAYITEVLVIHPRAVGLYQVILDAHTLDFLSVCTHVPPGSGYPPYPRSEESQSQPPQQQQQKNGQRGLISQPQQQQQRQRQRQRQLPICASRSTSQTFGNAVGITNCSINTLYLDDTNKKTTCTEVILLGAANSNPNVTTTVLVPKEDEPIHWRGTLDCFGSKILSTCRTVELPTTFEDALSDVQYGGIQTLKFLRRYLNVLGGLRVNANEAKPISAYVHYGSLYCNAFYIGSIDGVVFGDCDCQTYTPLVSIDVVRRRMNCTD